jgi:enoyl-CoA hydratase/carnithine racemase
MSVVRLERHGPIAVVTLDRPDRLNAISTTLTTEMNAALDAANGDPETRVIVLTGAGRAFCAGDDLKEFDDQTRDEGSIERHVRQIQDVTRKLMLTDRIVVGAVHGYAVGGGFEWMLNCDLVVASNDLTAFFPEMEWGQFVTGAVTHLLPLALGHQRTMELILLGERQSAAELAAMGLVNRVVAREDVLPTAMVLASKIAARSKESVSAFKTLVTQDLHTGIRTALDLETVATIAAFKRSDAAERVKTFQKRK